MHEQLTVGELFAGIGGFGLGLERAGMRVEWQCELDDFCTRVLEKHWPNVRRYRDVTELHSPPRVDVLVGGFPCQDISLAGKGAGLAGARSGLWSEFARLIGEVGPRWVIVENVPALRRRGLETVLEDLTSLGYDAEWDGISASAVGAPHQRDRIWLVAYPRREQLREQQRRRGRTNGEGSAVVGIDGSARDLADADGPPWHGPRAPGEAVPGPGEEQRPGRRGSSDGFWAAEPDVGRVAHGVPERLDRLKALGNALVPQIAEWIGRRIIAAERGLT